MMQASGTSTAEQAITTGSWIAGYWVERIVGRRRGGDTLVDAVAPDGERVALELVAPEISADEKLSQQIVERLELRAAIKHQSLLPVYRAGRDGRWLFLATAVPRGRTLAAHLEQRPLSPAEAIRLLEPVAAGLDAAAARALIHRDLAPATIVLAPGVWPPALLTDFGVTIPDRRACELPSIVEAAPNMPPEVVRGQPWLPQSNVYTLACVLVECLTGARPFERARPLLTLHAQLVEPPPRPSELRQGLPAALDDVIATALAKEPEDRFTTASELIHAARGAFASSHRAERREPRHERRRRNAKARAGFARLRTAPAVSLGLVVIATTSGFALGSVKHHDGGAPTGTESRVSPPSAAVRHAHVVRTVNTAMSRLVARRAAALHELSRARQSTAQAAQARLLANAYRDAVDELPASPMAGLGGLGHVASALRANADAYRGLATAAKAGDARGYQAASHAISARERELERAVNALAH